MMKTLAEQCYEELVGTAGFIDPSIWAEDNGHDVTLDFYQEIDNLMFLCELCGWWCEIGDMHENEDQTCSSCGNDIS